MKIERQWKPKRKNKENLKRILTKQSYLKMRNFLKSAKAALRTLSLKVKKNSQFSEQEEIEKLNLPQSSFLKPTKLDKNLSIRNKNSRLQSQYHKRNIIYSYS